MKKVISLSIVVAILVTTLAGCTKTSTQTQTNEVKNFKVWVLAPLSGPGANYGEDEINVFKLLVDKFNAENSGKLHASLVVEDSKCNGKDGASAAQKLISVDDVQVIVWEICSVASIPAGKIAQANKIPMIAPVSSAPDISTIGNYVFRFRNDAAVTKKLSTYLTKQWAKNIFVLVENTDYGVGYGQWIKDSFSWNVIEEKFQSDEKDFDILSKKILNAKDIDAVVFVVNSDGNTVSLIKSFDKNGVLKSFKWKLYGTEITTSDWVVASLWNLLNDIKVTQLVTIEELWQKAQKLTQEFESSFPIKWNMFYDVLLAEWLSLTLDAVKNVWYDADAIKNYFNSFNSSNQRDGYFGKYYFSPERDAVGLNFVIYQVNNGELTAIE